MRFAGDDAPDAAFGGGVVAGAAGDEVQVTMKDGLSGGGAIVDAEIEARDGGVFGLEVGRQFFGQAVGGGPFVRRYIAEGRGVASGDNQGVAGGDGEGIAEGDAGAIGGDDSVGGQRAKGTICFHAGILSHGGRGVECRAAGMKNGRGEEVKIDRRGRNPLYTQNAFGGEIAQLVEQRTENPCVTGSIPVLATIFLCVGKGCGAP